MMEEKDDCMPYRIWMKNFQLGRLSWWTRLRLWFAPEQIHYDELSGLGIGVKFLGSKIYVVREYPHGFFEAHSENDGMTLGE